MLSDNQLLEIKEKAEKATKGPYDYDQETPWDQGDCYARACIVINGSNWWCEDSRITGGEACQDVSTAAYLAACDPSTISTLVDEIVELRKDKERLAVLQAAIDSDGLVIDATCWPSISLYPVDCEEPIEGSDLREVADAALQAGGKDNNV